MDEKKLKNKLDYKMILIPIIFIGLLCGIFELFPRQSKMILISIRGLLSNQFGFFYILMAIVFFISTMFLAFSRYGNIKLGSGSPKYSAVKWGMMIFTSTMSADVIFYSLCEWIMYANEPFIKHQGGFQKWGLTYSLFHWGPLAWGFYIMLAVAFGYMLHVKHHNKQKFSEACRPLLGNKVDGPFGKIIDLLAIIALIAGTATTFSMATPLLAKAISVLLHIPNNKWLMVGILLVVVTIYTSIIIKGMGGISKLASICSVLFLCLLGYFLIFGNQTLYIVIHGFQSLGRMLENFGSMALTNNPFHPNSFAQNWTVYFWSYWMAWCVATPFFIGSISKGRTIRNVILGGYFWGLAGTYTSFMILGNYGMVQQVKHHVNLIALYNHTGSYADAILKIFNTMPMHTIGLILLIVTMIGLYSTVFDSITMVISIYSYKSLDIDQEPDVRIRVFWAIAFILLPIVLLLTGNSVYDIQSISIIGAFPIGIVMIIILISFYKQIIYKNNEKIERNK